MKNKMLERLNKARGNVLGTEMALNILEDDLEVIASNIIILLKLEEDLIYNIKLHRSSEVISSIREYKRSIDQLKEVKIELYKSKSLRDRVEKNMEEKLKSHDFYMKELENAHREIVLAGEKRRISFPFVLLLRYLPPI